MNPHRLLGLLRNRTKYSPAQWAAYDDNILGDAWKTSLMTLTYHPSCIVMCGANYGRMTPWNREFAQSRRILGYPRGLLVLEAQQKLLTFLSSTVNLILRGVARDDTVRQADKFIKTVSEGLIIADNSANMDRFESVYLNQSYSTPPVFDIHKLVSLAKCRLDWHTDHLWLLQSNTRYMRRTICHR